MSPRASERRDKEGKPVPNKYFLGKYNTPAGRAIYTETPSGEKVEILFSFCVREAVVDWEALRQAKGDPENLGIQADSWKQLSDAHKALLVKKLLEVPPLQLLDSKDEPILVERNLREDKDAPHRRTLVVVHSTMTLFLVRTASATITESPLPEDTESPYIDQSSHIAIRGKEAGRNSWLFQKPFQMRVTRTTKPKGSAPQKVLLDSSVIQAVYETTGCTAVSPLDLHFLLGEELEARYIFMFSPGEELVIGTRGFTVRQIGWVVTVPIFSELTAASRATSAKAFDATSSIPVSWVFGFGSAPQDNVAVSFPIRLAYSPRSYPDLGKWLGFYAHASFVFPVSGTRRRGGLPLASACRSFNF